MLTASLLKSILSFCGESNVDEALLEQMIERANVHHVLEGLIMLTPEAFEYALTSEFSATNLNGKTSYQLILRMSSQARRLDFGALVCL